MAPQLDRLSAASSQVLDSRRFANAIERCRAPGRQPFVNDHERVRWARALTTAGWLFVVAYLTFLVGQIRRAFAIGESSFEDGVWGLRVEQISFATLPQNVIIAVPAAAAGVAGTLLVGDIVDRSDIWLTQLVRIAAGLGYMIIGLGAGPMRSGKPPVRRFQLPPPSSLR